MLFLCCDKKEQTRMWAILFCFFVSFSSSCYIVFKKDKQRQDKYEFQGTSEELCVQTCILCIIKKLLSTSTCLCLLIHPHCSPIRSYTFMSLKILLLPVICQSQLLPEYPGWLSICYQSRITFTYSENLCFSS